MRFVPQGIEKENVEPFQLMEGRLRDFAVISEIRCVAKAETVDLHLAMNQPYGCELRPKKLHGPVNRPQLELRQAAIFVIGGKDVAEHLAQKGGGIGASIEGQLLRLMTETERAQIVDAQNMIGVRVRVENGIYASDPLANSLAIKIGRGIDEH